MTQKEAIQALDEISDALFDGSNDDSKEHSELADKVTRLYEYIWPEKFSGKI